MFWYSKGMGMSNETLASNLGVLLYTNSCNVYENTCHSCQALPVVEHLVAWLQLAVLLVRSKVSLPYHSNWNHFLPNWYVREMSYSSEMGDWAFSNNLLILTCTLSSFIKSTFVLKTPPLFRVWQSFPCIHYFGKVTQSQIVGRSPG